MVPHTDLTEGYPILGTLGQDWGTLPLPGTGVPPRKGMGPVEVLWDGDGVPTPPPRKGMEPEVALWDGDGVTPLPAVWTDRTDACENITSRPTTYVGGNLHTENC